MAVLVRSLTLLILLLFLQGSWAMMNRPPSVPLGAEWLNRMPQGRDWVPPNTAQPVKEVRFRTCKQGVNVVEYLYAEVRPANLGQGTAPNQSIRNWVQTVVGRRRDDAGHIVGANQGGLGTVQWNIFPQNGNINRGAYAQNVERMINDAVRRTGLVRMWFKFEYGNTSEPCRPTRFSYYILSSAFANHNDLVNP